MRTIGDSAVTFIPNFGGQFKIFIESERVRGATYTIIRNAADI